MPERYHLKEDADLADALNVFWSAGGLDFFNVAEPDYYASNWLGFLGELYNRIEGGEFDVSDKIYDVPLVAEQKAELVRRGVPQVFVTDVNV